jgi:ATP-dependent DNA ligase
VIEPPIEPMLAKPLGSEIPTAADHLSFEPKWDGFRCLVFRSADGVVLQGRGRSRSSADEVIDLAYAFPEVASACLTHLQPGTVIDAEIVVPHRGRLDFTVLSSRLRPRSEAGGPSIAALAETHPASLLAFDVLWADGDCRPLPFADRRRRLTALAAGWQPPLLLTPNTTDPDIASEWFHRFEAAGVDGLMVKDVTEPYLEGKRAQGKVKHQRTADVVVAGWRPHAKAGAGGSEVLGSLLLGLFDETGQLQYVGVSSAFTAKVRADLVELLAPLSVADGDPHPWRGTSGVRVPGTANRWKKEQAWHALRPELVAEVAYDQLEADRFRHVAGFLRWRPDREPSSCTYDQLAYPPDATIDDLLTPGRPL